MIEINEAGLEFREGLRTRDIYKIDKIILHHSASPMDSTTIHDIHRWHLQRGWLGCGYHYVIHEDGSIFQGRPLNTVGAHARGYNERSIGICVVGNFEVEYPNLYQQEALGRLLLHLINDKLSGQSLSIIRHKDISSTLCPGRNFTYFIPVVEYSKEGKIDKVKKIIQEAIYNLQQVRNILGRS